MFTRKPGLMRRRNRAVTLIEAVLYISVALALIVGGLVFFQQASTAAKTSTMVRQLSATIAEARVLIRGIPLTAVPVNVGSYLISAGAVPPDMVASPTSLVNPFGGPTAVYALFDPTYGALLIIETDDVPQGVCARLLTATSGSDFVYGQPSSGGTTIVSPGFLYSFAAPTRSFSIFRTWAMNPTQAGWMCRYGSNNYTVKTTQPASQPISGTVRVGMAFRTDT